LAGAIDALRLAMGVPRLPVDEPQFVRDLRHIAAAAEDTAASFAIGRAWSPDTLINAALEERTTDQ
jgi:hypothetical protein